MPTYEMSCQKCKYEFEQYLTFDEYDRWLKSDNLKVLCSKCKSDRIKRRYDTPPHTTIIGEPTTIGQLADRNTKSMGKTRYEEKELKNKKQEPSRWYGSLPKNKFKEIHTAKPKDKKTIMKKYIMEGK